jgi:hypothetical protein
MTSLKGYLPKYHGKTRIELSQKMELLKDEDGVYSF